MDKKDLYNSINQHLESIDDSLKTIACALSQSDDNSEDDENEVPKDALVFSNAEDALPYSNAEDALVFSNDIKREHGGE